MNFAVMKECALPGDPASVPPAVIRPRALGRALQLHPVEKSRSMGFSVEMARHLQCHHPLTYAVPDLRMRVEHPRMGTQCIAVEESKSSRLGMPADSTWQQQVQRGTDGVPRSLGLSRERASIPYIYTYNLDGMGMGGDSGT